MQTAEDANRQSSRNSPAEVTLTEYLRLSTDSDSYLWSKLQRYVKNKSEHPQEHSAIQLNGEPMLYEVMIRPIEWAGQRRLLVEVRRNSNQHFKASQEVQDMCRLSLEKTSKTIAEVN